MGFATRIISLIIGLSCFGNHKALANIRGTPGVDYPNYSSIPRTSFKCSEQEQPTGFFADPETQCQVFHYCYENRQETFLCPIGTTFNQAIKSCDYWYSSECDSVEVLHNLLRERNRFNDQPFVPVTSPPYNVFEKMVALQESNEKSYKQNDLPVFQHGDVIYENGQHFIEDGQDRNPLPTSLKNLEEIPQSGVQDLNFVTYGHDDVEVDDVEIVLSEADELKTLHNSPNLGYAEEESYEKELSDESDNYQLSNEKAEMLQRMYGNLYSPGEKINEINIDPNFSNMDDHMSSFELNPDAMLHKRFSEVESKKRRIRRKPKYVVLQTSIVDNPDPQKVDSEDKTESSMVTYAEGPDTPDINENAADTSHIGYGKLKRNRKPLRKDYSYSMDPGNVVASTELKITDIDGLESFNNLELRPKDEIEISLEEIEQAALSNSEEMHEFENTNSFYEENENSDHYKKNDLNNLFTLSESDYDNPQNDIEKPMETEKSHLDPNTMNSDEINQILRSNNNYEMYEEHGTEDIDEDKQIEESSDLEASDIEENYYVEVSDLEESSDVEASDLEESSDVEASDLEDSSDVEASDLEESSDVEASDLEESFDMEASDLEESFDMEASDLEENSDVEASDNEESSDFVAFDSNLEDMYRSESPDSFSVNEETSHSDLGESNFVLEYAEENSDIDNSFSDSDTEFFESNESYDRDSSNKEFTETESLNSFDQVTSVDQHDQSYFEFAEKESTSATNEINDENLYFELENAIQADENHNLEEVDADIEREGSSDFRVNSKYLNFDTASDSDTTKDYEGDGMHDTDLQETRDIHTNAEINIDSLEYFESEGQGYFVDEHGRIYILSGEKGDSETLIYVGDIDTEDNSDSDTELFVPQTESSLLATDAPEEDSNLPVEPQESVEVDFNSVVSEENEFGYQDTNDLEDDINLDVNQNAQRHVENSVLEQGGGAINFPETETKHEQNGVAIPQIEETDVSPPNLNQTNATEFLIDASVDIIKDKAPFEHADRHPPVKVEISIPEIFDEMAHDSNVPKEVTFHLSSIPLPANAYEKGLYDEKIKSSQQEPVTVSNNVYPASFYKELQAVPLKKYSGDSKTSETDTQTAELLNIKTGLFRNIKSDLESEEVKSAVSEVAFPSKIINNLFSSFSSPFQPTPGKMQDIFPLRSPKFRNLPDYPPRSGKVFKPARVFKLINFGKKLLKMKQAKLKSLREYISS